MNVVYLILRYFFCLIGLVLYKKLSKVKSFWISKSFALSTDFFSKF